MKCPHCKGRGHHLRHGAIRKDGVTIADYVRVGDNCRKCYGTGSTLNFSRASIGLFNIALFLVTFLICLAL